MTIEFYKRLNSPLVPTNPRDFISAKHFFNDIQDRVLKGSLDNRCQSEVKEDIETGFGHILIDDQMVSAEVAAESAVRLLEEDCKGIVKNMTIQVQDKTATLPKSLFVLFLYNLISKHAEMLTTNAILRLHISEGNGRVKGIVKIDGYGRGEHKAPAKLEENTFAVNFRKLKSQDLINMMSDAGHASYITNYNDFSTGFQIGIHNYKVARNEKSRQRGQEKIVH